MKKAKRVKKKTAKKVSSEKLCKPTVPKNIKMSKK